MDAADSISATRSSHARAPGFPAGGRRSAARIGRTLDGSNLSRLTALEFGERFGGESIELSFGRVALDLTIPRLPVVLDKPIAERGELVGRELFDFALDGFDLRH